MVPPTHRYYAGALNRCFPFQVLSSRSFLIPLARKFPLRSIRTLCRQCRLSSCLGARAFSCAMELQRFPRSVVPPVHACSDSLTPGDRMTLAISHHSILPSDSDTASAPHLDFRGSITRLLCLLSTLHTSGHPSCARLAFQPLARLC